MWIYDDDLNTILIVQFMKEKTGKLHFTKIKNMCSSEKTVKRMKR